MNGTKRHPRLLSILRGGWSSQMGLSAQTPRPKDTLTLSGKTGIPVVLSVLFMCSLLNTASANDLLVTTLERGVSAIEQLSPDDGAQPLAASLSESGVLPGGIAFDGLDNPYVFDLKTGLVYSFDLETGVPGAAVTTSPVPDFSAMIGTPTGLLVAGISGADGLHVINTINGRVEQLCSGSIPVPVSALAMEDNDTVLIASSFTGEVYRLDLVTCTSIVVSSGYFANPVGIALGADGDIFVIDQNAGGRYGAYGSIFRIDRESNTVSTVVSEGRYFADARQLVAGLDGRLLVLDAASGISSVDTQTGEQSLVYAGDFATADTVDLDPVPQTLDDDGIADKIDNCPTIDNTDQLDSNQDGFGDACVSPKITIPEYAEIDSTVVIGSGKMKMKSSVLESGVVLGENITAESNVYVSKDTIIGNDVLLGKNAVIGSGVRIGNNVSLGDGVTIQDGAVIGNDSQIGSSVCISSSATVGSLVNIGSNNHVSTGEEVPDGVVWGDRSSKPSDCSADA
jgi:carbonic anhydrase/acetyltransferase-like protein (isoleucine patch superfamily)